MKKMNVKLKLKYDRSKPDGMPRKVLDVSKLKDLGWESKISLNEGLASTYDWYLSAIETGQVRL